MAKLVWIQNWISWLSLTISRSQTITTKTKQSKHTIYDRNYQIWHNLVWNLDCQTYSIKTRKITKKQKKIKEKQKKKNKKHKKITKKLQKK